MTEKVASGTSQNEAIVVKKTLEERRTRRLTVGILVCDWSHRHVQKILRSGIGLDLCVKFGGNLGRTVVIGFPHFL